MVIKFLAVTQDEFPFSTSGTKLQKGALINCTEEFAKMALEKYPEDFEIIKEFVPDHNKMMQKTVTFKSK